MAAICKLEPGEENSESVKLTNKMDSVQDEIKIKTEPIDPDSSNSDSEDHGGMMNHPFEKELRDLPEVRKYIHQLQSSIIGQRLKLDKLERKVKKLKKHYKKKKTHRMHITNTSTQTEELAQESLISSTLKIEATAEEATEHTDAWVLTEDDNVTSGASVPSLAEQVTQAAQSAMQNTSFVYEPNSGMYYDYTTGYYYNAEMGLYYDGNTGTYFCYDEVSKSYTFHSQVEVFQNVTDGSKEPIVEKEKSVKRVLKKSIPKVKIVKELKEKVQGSESPEDGECSESSVSDELLDSEADEEPEKVEVKKVWPPCMRIIVLETTVERLKVGTLFIVTCTGGTMGREGDHCVFIPDTNISKHHAKFSFNEAEGKYYIIDFGSRNGTILNNKRLSVALQESEPAEVVHGSTIVVGNTKLLCHIHAGTETCGHCEPGLVQQVVPETVKYVFTSGSVGKAHRKELKRIRKKFGLTNTKSTAVVGVSGEYEDRAQLRRDTVGSTHHEDKMKVASVHEAIAEDNKGFRMLAKMGWSKGEALGKEGGGLIEPVLVEQRDDKVGLGAVSRGASSKNQTRGGRRKVDVWKRTQERYEQVSARTLPLEGDDEKTLSEVKDVTKKTQSHCEEVKHFDAVKRAEADATLQVKEVRKKVAVKKSSTKAETSEGSPSSPKTEASNIDERKNSVWKKTQMRLKVSRKGVTPPASPPKQDAGDVA